MEDRPCYIENWDREPTQQEYERMDDEAKTFYREFVPLYRKHVGTKGLLRHIRNYINTHEIIRKDDFRFTLIIMWCDHIHYYRDRHGIPFEAEDVFSIRIPEEILRIQ